MTIRARFLANLLRRRSFAAMFALLLMPCFIGGCAQAKSTSSITNERVYVEAAVAADHAIASAAGVAILQQGGNAVDAAVATSFCLSVVRPYSCGIGGGGFMLIYIPAREGAEPQTIAINYRETAAAAVGPDYYAKLNDPLASRFGHHAVGVPGTVAGLAHALNRYGTLDLSTVLQPAIRAAEDGFAADENVVAAANELAKELEKNPALMKCAAPIWQEMCLSGKLKIGDIIRQPQQAKALRLIAEKGPDVFYRGEIGHAIFASMHTHGGPIRMADLKDYQVQEVQPLQGRFREFTMLSMPPPSSGGIAMQQVLGILERKWSDAPPPPHNSAAYIHLLTEALKHAFADRSRWLGDSDFVDVPIEQLTNSQYLDEVTSRITSNTTLEPQAYGSSSPLPDDAGTSHFCVIDSTGMAVACTETINTTFGSLVTVPGFGFVLNNEMDDFTTIANQPNAFGLMQSDRNLPQPGKRPLSSMSPTILLKDGKVALIAGASGGPRIITGTMQCILNCIVFDMQPTQAVGAPRFHHQWMPNQLQLEQPLQGEAAKMDLIRRGHEIGAIAAVGQVQLIRIDADGVKAASDPRKGGAPAGY